MWVFVRHFDWRFVKGWLGMYGVLCWWMEMFSHGVWISMSWRIYVRKPKRYKPCPKSRNLNEQLSDGDWIRGGRNSSGRDWTTDERRCRPFCRWLSKLLYWLDSLCIWVVKVSFKSIVSIPEILLSEQQRLQRLINASLTVTVHDADAHVFASEYLLEYLDGGDTVVWRQGLR